MITPEYLRRSELFLDLPGDLLERVSTLGEERAYAPGQYVFVEGEESKALYVVGTGLVALEMNLHIGRADGSGRKAFIAVLGPSECFGWSALVPPHQFTMSAIAVQASTVLAIDGAALQQLIAQQPGVGLLLHERLNRLISSRLTEARAKLCTIIALISHELKAPLAAVESYMQVLLGGYAGDLTAQQRDMIDRCSVRVQELIELIGVLLRVSHIERGDLTSEMTTASLRTIIDEALENVTPAARAKAIDIGAVVPEGLPPLPMSRLRIQEAVTNLLDNAVKFTPEGGRVAVILNDRVDHVEVEVRDSGMGIAEDELPRIFDEFYRGRMARAQGLGLGLSLVKKIIEAHHGQIWVESPPPGEATGSSIHFTLPKRLPMPDASGVLSRKPVEAA